ncbi:uncharacterized protein LOC127009273 isoform X2 [Eriocheir sinensis]|uniref:uncharacterized protein LOC127009273 isoform X2 n=1 Tax=Eriocheir sinensis TaxID=95602 RepID=UPI0021C845DE|nr:uncharacterized protein LOC127009273 isoform X2 [Eriocheir sinensis]XP_050738135.1 uncharacterized protein LOC127009273 isoform X2 [Eriocheir sinensis]XP_050738137.1 uncharacterized protein LOC127009273 isoform X2 [Eriocheir sinensis]
MDGQQQTALQTEIFDAVESGNFERMRELLQDTGPGVRHGNTRCTLLHAAVEHQQVDMVLFLLKVISPNVVNKDGRTPAHLAARSGHTQVLRLLLADPQMDPDKRDSSRKTYKHWLVLPLLEAVLKNSRAKVQELLRLDADPDCAVEPLWEGPAATELQVTTARQLAHTLHHDDILALLKRQRAEDDAEDDDPGVPLQTMVQRDNSGTNKKIKLCVDVSPAEISGKDVYKMDAAPRGYVCLLGYGSFKGRPDLNLEGSETDAHNLANIFSKMGYSGRAHFSLTAKQTRQQLADLRDNKMLEQAGCAVFVISSHGASRRHFLTSDMQTIDTQWVLDFFKDSQCPSLKNKPKLFIWNLCRGHLQEESGRGGSQGEVSSRVDEPLRDVMCLEAASGSFSWHSFSEDGTPFIGALCRTLARHAATKELTQLYRDFLQEYTDVAPYAVPQLTNHGFSKRFYFNPDIKNCVSGNL